MTPTRERNAAPSRIASEVRRLCAIPLFGLGMTGREVGRRLGVSSTSASRWLRALKSGGEEALARRPAPGRPPRLSSSQLAELKIIYEIRPYWSQRDLRDVIAERFGIRYQEDHVPRILRSMGIQWKHRGEVNR